MSLPIFVLCYFHNIFLCFFYSSIITINLLVLPAFMSTLHSVPVMAHGSGLTKAHISLAYQSSLFKILKQFYRALLILQHDLLCFLKLLSNFDSTMNILNTSIKNIHLPKTFFFPFSITASEKRWSRGNP